MCSSDLFRITKCHTPRRANKLEEGQQGTPGAATTIAYNFIFSQVHILMLESTPYFLKSTIWTDDLTPFLSITGYCWKTVEVSAQQVGALTKRKNIRRLYPNHPSAEERITRRRTRPTDMRA